MASAAWVSLLQAQGRWILESNAEGVSGVPIERQYGGGLLRRSDAIRAGAQLSQSGTPVRRSRTSVVESDLLASMLVGASCKTDAPNNNPTTGAVNYNGFAVIGNTVSSPRYFQVGGYLRF